MRNYLNLVEKTNFILTLLDLAITEIWLLKRWVRDGGGDRLQLLIRLILFGLSRKWRKYFSFMIAKIICKALQFQRVQRKNRKLWWRWRSFLMQISRNVENTALLHHIKQLWRKLKGRRRYKLWLLQSVYTIIWQIVIFLEIKSFCISYLRVGRLISRKWILISFLTWFLILITSLLKIQWNLDTFNRYFNSKKRNPITCGLWNRDKILIEEEIFL